MSLEHVHAEMAANILKRGLDADQVSANQVVVFGNEKNLWLSFFEGSWYIGTWVPAAYKIPESSNIEELCYQCLHAPSYNLFCIPNEVIQNFSLISLSESEFQKVYDAIEVKDNEEADPPLK